MTIFEKLRSLLRQILLYAMAIAIPLCAVFSSAASSRSALRQEVHSANLASVELLRASLDATFRELRDTLTVAGTNPNLSRYKLLADPLNSSTALADAIAPHIMLADMVLYVRGEDQFCSSTGAFDVNSLSSQPFARDFSSFGSLEDWVNIMQNVTEQTYWAGSGSIQTEYLYLFSPVFYLFQYDGSVAQRTACLMIRQSYIHDMFRSSQTDSGEALLLLDPACNPISKLTNRLTDNHVSDVCSYIHANPELLSTGFAELPESDLLLFVTRSSDTGLIYVRFLPRSIAYSTMDTQTTLVISFLILIAIIGFVLIATNMHRGYRPMQSLANWIQGTSERSAEISPHSSDKETPFPLSDPSEASHRSALLDGLLSGSALDYDLAQLDAAMAARNPDMAQNVIRRLHSVVKLSDDPAAAKRVYGRISDCLHLPAPSESADYGDIDSLFDALTVHALAILTAPAKQEPLVQTDIGAQLLEYIDAHCLSYDFQLKNMAEHFAISPQYMRKLFKAHVGLSLSEYVSNKRLEKATFLLSETDMPLQDIVTEIGNSDISGFVRFFKQRTGMTPGQFRKAQKEKV